MNYQELIIRQMLQSNPNINKVMQYINENGGDPKTAFYKLAEEKGVDPQELINKINNFAKL